MFFVPNRRWLLVVCAAVVAICTLGPSTAQADPPSLLQKMFHRDVAGELKNVRYELTEEDGPWMVLATTFVGHNAKQSAETAAEEIRSELRLPAFIYREKFDFTGRLEDANSQSRRMRYANAYQYDAYAVLVGEYDTVEHPSIERDLKALKSFSLSVYQDPNAVKEEINTSTPATTIKAFSHKLFQSRKGRNKGPMANAFVTRNPMLPEEYFSAPKVDSFVRQLNDGKDFSLLDCDGKYTVVVCTFEGLGTIVDGKKEKDFVPSIDRLDKYAADAGKMVKQLRQKGDEAYQFHDRYRSLVTIGSFETLGRPLPGGGFEYSPEIRRVMQKYSAFNSQVARTIPGKSGIAANHAAMIPFDVQPTPIAVPKQTKRSLYGAKFGMR
ncbi:MAG: hypothetical protein HKN47_08445 [Pirellulaceae bacterium]|nr:hypothetical protein [Pirellulaceae bacterium]